MSKLLSTLLGVSFAAFAIGASAQGTATPSSTPAAAPTATAAPAAPKATKKPVKKAKAHHHKTAAKAKAQK